VGLAAGARIGPYEVKSLLGAGGMGEVYLAFDPRLGREVAVKILPAASAENPGWAARFEREARAVAALNHPNIVVVHDVGTDHGQSYLVAELLVGENLRARVGAGPVPLPTAQGWVVQIARGLAAAHARGIVHRDLKPENLFVTREGVVKILDFGIAKVADAGGVAPGHESTLTPHATDVHNLTASGAIVGTVGYMSPEQVLGKPADARSDNFGFGALAYELVTGRRAFQAATRPELAVAILKEEPPPMTTASGSAPPELERIVRRCLAKRPEDRFQTARDLCFALEALASPAVHSPGAERLSSRRRWPIMLAGAVLVAGGIAAGVLLAGRGRPDGPPAAPAPPPAVPAGDAGRAAGAPIAAGCSFSAMQLNGQVGSVHQVACPANCASESGGLYGTDSYIAVSSVCLAGIHAGAIPPSGGTIAVRIEPGRPAYRGSTRHGVRSGDYGSFNMGFSVALPGGRPADAGASPAVASPIEAGCSFNAMQLNAEVGSVYEVACPANCPSEVGGLYGTDSYIAVSSVCLAGIHAGAIPPGGGTIAVRIEPGRPAYRGSTRHGVRSADYGSFNMSFSVALPGGGPADAGASPAVTSLIEAGCSFSAMQLNAEVGSVHQVACPANCPSESGALWGTDFYVATSSVCLAGIHAGAIPPGGGTIAVRIEPGRPAYRGSTRNGLKSGDMSSFQMSFSVSRP
jgi:hypothetical protein